MSDDLRIAAATQPQHARSYCDLRDAWLRAEELGADTTYIWDHFSRVSRNGGSRDP